MQRSPRLRGPRWPVLWRTSVRLDGRWTEMRMCCFQAVSKVLQTDHLRGGGKDWWKEILTGPRSEMTGIHLTVPPVKLPPADSV